jgi:hypothetical protein
MISANAIRLKRRSAGISCDLLAKHAEIDAGSLSRIERGIRRSSEGELTRIDAALTDLCVTKEEIEKFAASKGWPVEAASV